MSCSTAGPHELRAKAAEHLSRLDGGKIPVRPHDLHYYSFPKAYGSTAGPFGGIGGQAITSFQIDSFEGPCGRSVWFCGGRMIPKKDDQALYGFFNREELDEYESWQIGRGK